MGVVRSDFYLKRNAAGSFGNLVKGCGRSSADRVQALRERFSRAEESCRRLGNAGISLAMRKKCNEMLNVGGSFYVTDRLFGGISQLGGSPEALFKMVETRVAQLENAVSSMGLLAETSRGARRLEEYVRQQKTWFDYTPRDKQALAYMQTIVDEIYEGTTNTDHQIKPRQPMESLATEVHFGLANIVDHMIEKATVDTDQIIDVATKLRKAGEKIDKLFSYLRYVDLGSHCYQRRRDFESVDRGSPDYRHHMEAAAAMKAIEEILPKGCSPDTVVSPENSALISLVQNEYHENVRKYGLP